MYQLDPDVEEKLVHHRDRARLEAKLREYPPDEQRKWMANPAVSFILHSFMNQLLGGIIAGPVDTKQTNAKADTEKQTSKKEDSSDDDPMMDLFD